MRQEPPKTIETYQGRSIHGGCWIKCRAWSEMEAAATFAKMLFRSRKWRVRRRAADGAWEVCTGNALNPVGTGTFLSVRVYVPTVILTPLPEPPASHFPVDERDICENNHGGDEESEAAWELMQEESSAAILRARIYAFIATQGRHGAITDELEAPLGLLNQTASPRMSELKAEDRIIWNGERRLTKSKRQAKVFVTVEVWRTICEQSEQNQPPK